nr:phosphoglycerate mutase family protein [Aeromonas hydrophila]
MQLVVMRHGQTPANAEERYQGALDIGLSDTGVAQISAQARALAMAQAPFQRLLSSPLAAGTAKRGPGGGRAGVAGDARPRFS